MAVEAIFMAKWFQGQKNTSSARLFDTQSPAVP